jgi:ADP-ribose pyrophosphatase
MTSSLHSPTALFLASQLSFTETNMESTEQIERIEMPLAEAMRMVMDSEITHAPSCVAILKACTLFPDWWRS